MKRYVCFVALLGVVAIPDWASAFFRPWCAPPPCSPYGYGYGGYGGFRGYAVPVPVYSPPVFIQPCVPVYEVPVAPPRVYQVPPAAAAVAPIPAANPVKPPVQPPVAAAPKPAPKPATVKPPEPDPMFRPAGGPMTASPSAAPSPASAPKPESETSPLVLPPVPDTKPMSPLVPSAMPSPAPAPSPPVATGGLPVAPKKPSSSDDTLPPLVLPPEGPGGPSGVVPPVGDTSTSRSSPLTAGPKVQVFTVAGGAVSGQLRKVGFFNHTDRDIDLVIAGRAVKLPRKTYLHAQLPPTFTWKQADRKAETATVPDGAAGLDVLFRE